MDLQNSKKVLRILSFNFSKFQLNTTFHKLYENCDKVQLCLAKYRAHCSQYLKAVVLISWQARLISYVPAQSCSD